MIPTELIMAIVIGIVIGGAAVALVLWLLKDPADTQSRQVRHQPPLVRPPQDLPQEWVPPAPPEGGGIPEGNVREVTRSFSVTMPPEILDLVRDGRSQEAIDRLCREPGMDAGQAARIVDLMAKLPSQAGFGPATVVSTPVVKTTTIQIDGRGPYTIPEHIIALAREAGVETAAATLSREMNIDPATAQTMLSELMKQQG